MLKRRKSPITVWTCLGLGILGLLWLAVLAVVWWWLPYPARATLSSGQLVPVGFSADGETFVTMRRLVPKEPESEEELIEAMAQFLFPLYSGPIQLWDTGSGKERARLAENWKQIRRVAVSPQGHFVAGGSEDGGLKMWDLQTGKEVASLPVFMGSRDEDFFWFSPDGSSLATAGGSKDTPLVKIKIWDTSTGAERVTIGHHAYYVAFSPDGKSAAVPEVQSGGRISAITLWDVPTGEQKATLPCSSKWIEALAFSPDGSKLVAGTASNTFGEHQDLELWDVATGEKRVSVQNQWLSGRPALRFRRMKFSPDGQYLIAQEGGGFLGPQEFTIRDANTLQRVGPTTANEPLSFFVGANEPAFCPGRPLVAMTQEIGMSGVSFNALARGRTLALCDPATLAEQVKCEAPWWLAIGPPRFSPDGKLVAAEGSYIPIQGRALTEVKIWDPATGKTMATLRGCSDPLFSPDGKTLAARRGSRIKLFDVPVPSRIWRLIGATIVWALIPVLIARLRDSRIQKTLDQALPKAAKEC